MPNRLSFRLFPKGVDQQCGIQKDRYQYVLAAITISLPTRARTHKLDFVSAAQLISALRRTELLRSTKMRGMP